MQSRSTFYNLQIMNIHFIVIAVFLKEWKTSIYKLENMFAIYMISFYNTLLMLLTTVFPI